ncbi:MAG: hypothetical protein LBM98_08955 [Oscillospiraceae bacterium]|jgi:hypothetical protein|nr:hypothetical protein [Oscillospiraceae bacterium]
MTIRCSLALCLRNAADGRALERGDIRARIGGEEARARYHSGGYWSFTGLELGVCIIELVGTGYKPETLKVKIPKVGFETRLVYLVPASGLPEGETLTLNGRDYFIPANGATLRVAQDSANAGESAVRVYPKGGVDLPCTFIIGEVENIEVCTVEELSGGIATLSEPLKYTHSRGGLFRRAAVGG